MQSTENLRTSPEGSFTSAISPSLLSNCAELPAERTTCPPRPGYSSRLWTMVPGGMCLNCSALPGRMSAMRCSSRDRKSTRLNSSHGYISYAVFCLKKKKNDDTHLPRDTTVVSSTSYQ